MKSRTYLMGAGFSKALNPAYPTLAELSSAVVTNFLKRYPTGAIREHFDQLPKGFDLDIEQLLTYLYSDWPWKSSVDSDLDRALYKAFVYEIAGALEQIEMIPIPDEFRMFIHFLRSLNSNQIISLNYDNLIEQYRFPFNFGSTSMGLKGLEIEIEEAYTSNRKTSTQVPWVAEESTKPSTAGGRKNLMIAAREWIRQTTLEDFTGAVAACTLNKNDASDVFWLKTNFNHLRNFDSFYPVERVGGSFFSGLDPRQLEGVTGKTIHLHGSLYWKGEDTGPTIRVQENTGTGRLESLPAIVPPIMDKSQHYAAGKLRKQWIRAHQAIQMAQEIVVIGFSFPPTDISCQFLFKSAVMPGSRVVVVNRDLSLKSRYDTIFGSIANVDLDYSYVGGEDALSRYIQREVMISSA